MQFDDMGMKPMKLTLFFFLIFRKVLSDHIAVFKSSFYLCTYGMYLLYLPSHDI